MNTMTKADFTELLLNKTGYSHKEFSQIVDQIFELIKSALESGEPVKISGLGAWTVKDKKPRKGRNPATGEDMQIKGRKVVTFKMSNRLKEKMYDE